MLKSLLLASVFIVGLAVYVSIQDECAAQKAAQEAKQASKGAVSAVTDANHPQQNVPNTEWRAPCWYGFFRWPLGTTTWAIILTLLAIAEQTRQTAKAANATQSATELMGKNIILQFRPRLILRDIALSEGTQIPTVGIPDAKPWKVDFVLANTGGSPANLVNHSLAVTAFEKGLPPRLSYKPQQFTKTQRLETGENRELELSVEIEQDIVPYFRMIGTTSPWDMSHQKIGHVYFWGRFQYSDDLAIVRNIAFCRHYNTKTGKFDAINDPDYEYAD